MTTTTSSSSSAPTVVLVHGTFAESASWNGVITELHARGHRVLAVANPLRGLRKTPPICAASSTPSPGRSSSPAIPTAAR